MSYDSIIKFLNDWTNNFGGFIDFATRPLSDFIPQWMDLVLPEFIAQFTLFQVMFGVGFMTYLAVVIVKFVLDTLPVV